MAIAQGMSVRGSGSLAPGNRGSNGLSPIAGTLRLSGRSYGDHNVLKLGVSVELESLLLNDKKLTQGASQ